MRNPDNPNVSTDLAMEHIFHLSSGGVGKRAIAAATDLNVDTIARIKNGRRKVIRLGTALKILSITLDAAEDNATVDAKPARRQIDELLSEGFTKKEIARRLGYQNCQLQFYGPRMKARNIMRVDRFYRTIMAGGEAHD